MFSSTEVTSSVESFTSFIRRIRVRRRLVRVIDLVSDLTIGTELQIVINVWLYTLNRPIRLLRRKLGKERIGACDRSGV